MTRGLVRKGECVQCGECCKKIRITSILSHILNQHRTLEDAKAYYFYRGITLSEMDKKRDRILLELSIRCSRLTPDNKCDLHDTPEKKPAICHRYPWFEDDIESCGYSFERSGFVWPSSRQGTPSKYARSHNRF